MSTPLMRWARGRWAVLRVRRPRFTRRVESGMLGLRGTAHLVDEVRSLRARVAELERDHALLAAHVAVLGEAAPGEVEPAPSVEAVRLSAIAFYEHRISALEARLSTPIGRRHAGTASARWSVPGTSGYEAENAS